MPLVLEETEVAIDWADLETRIKVNTYGKDGVIETSARSNGVHMSGILRPLSVAAGKLDEYEDAENRNGLVMILGKVWEELIASLHPMMIYDPGETELDGIWMTCDGITLEEDAVVKWPALLDFPELCGEWCVKVIDEMKYTTAAERTTDPDLSKDKSIHLWQKKEWMKMHQGMAYCNGYNAQIVRWHVCHAKGNYRDRFLPLYKRYVFAFTQAELAASWEMFTANKDIAIPESHDEESDSDLLVQ